MMIVLIALSFSCWSILVMVGICLGWMEFMRAGVLSFQTLSTSLIVVAARPGILGSRSPACFSYVV